MKTYKWLGPNRFVPPFGYMETGKETPPMPLHAAKYFESVGWLQMKAADKRKGRPASKEVKLTENLKVGDR